MEGDALRITVTACKNDPNRRKIVAAPPSKSMAHRHLICAALAGGESTVSNVAFSEDVLATIDCLRALGVRISAEEDPEAAIDGGQRMLLRICGADPRNAADTVLDCRESGSTLRFMIPLAAATGRKITLTGSGRLMERPLSVYEDLFRERETELIRSGEGVTVCGNLRGGEYVMDGSVSSQFISGMLFALPLMEEDSVIRLKPPVESRPYIDMTLNALSLSGVRAVWEDETTLRIPGSQQYKAAEITVEGDWSNGAYLMAAGADVCGLDPDSLQGDRICKEYFIMLDEGRAELDISDCPDLGPALMAYAAMRYGCVLRATARLKIKESDRGAAMKEELAKFGVDVEINDNNIRVSNRMSKPAEILSGHNDHRIVMALTALCSETGGTIEGAEAVAKSFPDFFETLRSAGVIQYKENQAI
ncbi:MAG: 3-phosphoshikimate 1-carboxyvinyltransferase [Mogibacterium sp.]|nr:3-phosphoshikimate 1-carboxyvinyltransferase [Mogibacterium sp.]